MSTSHPRAGGPHRRTFTPQQKLAHLEAYEQARDQNEGGAYLRREGLYSSLITEWRRLRDAGVLEGKSAGQSVGRPSKDQAEIARLRRELETTQQRLGRTEAALEIMGKARALLEDISESGGHRDEAQAALMDAYDQLTISGTNTRAAAGLTGVPRATALRRRSRTVPTPLEAREPANRLTCAERATVLAVLTSTEFVDSTPMQVFATLLDRGVYLCSVSSMYRILAEHTMVKERRRQARHPARKIPELVATGPGQVYTWDITKLAGPVKGVYYDAYVMIDIYSRYIVGVHVHARETGLLAEEMMREVFTIHGIPDVVHADRGTSMTSKSVATLLSDLGVVRSHSRPKVSNDNPFSEAWFKTLKYAPVFPERFTCLAAARGFLDEFVTWYNHEHRHQGLGLHTPADVHYGLATAKATERVRVLATARAAHPERFGTDHTPKALALPEAAWINKPHQQEQHQPNYEIAA
ncbi:MAG: IS3 family transposase [Brachybacterium tyrofermentans]|uniref:IS3 family transposase n=2 Tax=Brachybacterium TaxID=43668 RepID=A0ABW0FAI6_9MICO